MADALLKINELSLQVRVSISVRVSVQVKVRLRIKDITRVGLSAQDE